MKGAGFRKGASVALAFATVLCGCSGGASQDMVEELAALRSGLQDLRDREQIRELLVEYGRRIDARDFAGFGQLFVEDGEYVSAGTTSRGPEAIAAFLEDIFQRNPSGIASPNFHVFFNETIDVEGDQARAVSMSFFVVPGERGAPQVLMLGSYDDELVRDEDGRWKFRRRVVKGELPAPRSASTQR